MASISISAYLTFPYHPLSFEKYWKLISHLRRTEDENVVEKCQKMYSVGIEWSLQYMSKKL